MPALVYSGFVYNMTSEQAVGLRDKIKTIVKEGRTSWIALHDQDGGKTDILISPGVPVAFRDDVNSDPLDSIG